MTLTYQAQCQFWIAQYRLDHYGLHWPSKATINAMLLHTYDPVCNFAIFSNLFWVALAGYVLLEVTWRSSNPSSECRMVLEKLLTMPVLWQSKNEFELLFNEIGSKQIPLNILTTIHPENHTYWHLHHQHALRITRRITFNRNVVKLLDFLLELQNTYSVTASTGSCLGSQTSRRRHRQP